MVYLNVLSQQPLMEVQDSINRPVTNFCTQPVLNDIYNNSHVVNSVVSACFHSW